MPTITRRAKPTWSVCQRSLKGRNTSSLVCNLLSASMAPLTTYFDGRKRPRKLPKRGNIMEDNKLAVEESRRVGQLESLKGEVEGEVTSDIAARAKQGSPGDSQRMNQVAGQLR